MHYRNFLLTASMLFSIALGTSAHAQQGDIVFLVDESGSVDDIQGSLETNIINIANDLEVAGIDWRIAIGGFGGTSLGNPRVVSQFTNSVAAVQSAAMSLVATGSSEYGLEAIADATTNVDTNYGALREGAGYCVILLTDEDSDYRNGATADRAAALAGLESTGSGFIGVVDPGDGATAEDYDALVSGTVRGAIFDVADYVNDPTATNASIISTCIEEILTPEEPEEPQPPVDPKGCPNSVFDDGRMYNAALELVANQCSDKKQRCESVYFFGLQAYAEARCEKGEWVPVTKPKKPAPDACPNGVFDNGQMYDSKLNLVANQCATQGQSCPSVYFYGLGNYSQATCDKGQWEASSPKK